MAITDEGSLGSVNSFASGSTLAITTSQDANVGDVIIVLSAWDNNNGSTIYGPSQTSMTCTDDNSNSYSLIFGGEDASTNNRVALAAFMAVVSGSTLTSGSSITISYGTRVAKSATAHLFSMDGTGLRVAFRDMWYLRAVDIENGYLKYAELSDAMESDAIMLWGLGGEGPTTDAYTLSDVANSDTWTTLGADDGTNSGTATSDMHHRGRFIIRTPGETTYENFGGTSDTADRDYTQGFAMLLEIPSSESALPVVDVPTFGEGFRFSRVVGQNHIALNVQNMSVTPSQGRTVYMPIAGAPEGSLLVVLAASDNNNTVTQTGPNDTAAEITDSESNTWLELAGAQDAKASQSGQAAWHYASFITNEIPRGGYITWRYPNSTTVRGVCLFAMLFGCEGTTLTVADRAMEKDDGLGLGDCTIASLTSRRYLMLWNAAIEWNSSDEWDIDEDYSYFATVGHPSGGTESMSMIPGYRIATLTSEVVTVDAVNKRGTTQVLSANYTNIPEPDSSHVHFSIVQ